MSVLIKNKDIPKGCEQCWFNGHTKCRIMPIGFDEYPLVGRRPDWCPMVEIKKPHGRIGDLDALKTAFPICENGTNIKVSAVRRAITRAETIVAAEGSEK